MMYWNHHMTAGGWILGEIKTDQYEQLRETLDTRAERAPASPPAIR